MHQIQGQVVGIFKTHQSVWCMKILDSTGLVKEFGAMFPRLKWLKVTRKNTRKVGESLIQIINWS